MPIKNSKQWVSAVAKYQRILHIIVKLHNSEFPMTFNLSFAIFISSGLMFDSSAATRPCSLRRWWRLRPTRETILDQLFHYDRGNSRLSIHRSETPSIRANANHNDFTASCSLLECSLCNSQQIVCWRAGFRRRRGRENRLRGAGLDFGYLPDAPRLSARR